MDSNEFMKLLLFPGLLDFLLDLLSSSFFGYFLPLFLKANFTF